MAIKLGLRFELRLDECRRLALLSFRDLLLCEAQKNVVKAVVLKILSRVASVHRILFILDLLMVRVSGLSRKCWYYEEEKRNL